MAHQLLDKPSPLASKEAQTFIFLPSTIKVLACSGIKLGCIAYPCVSLTCIFLDRAEFKVGNTCLRLLSMFTCVCFHNSEDKAL